MKTLWIILGVVVLIVIVLLLLKYTTKKVIKTVDGEIVVTEPDIIDIIMPASKPKFKKDDIIYAKRETASYTVPPRVASEAAIRKIKTYQKDENIGWYDSDFEGLTYGNVTYSKIMLFGSRTFGYVAKVTIKTK